MTARYYFDIPVYRLAEDHYYLGRDEYIKGALYPKGSSNSQPLHGREDAHSDSNIALRDHLIQKYGGCWKFNEIIGYIRLYFLGSQVRGEYFAVRMKHIVRTRTKVFECRTWKLAPEVEIPYPHTSKGIYSAVLEYLAVCRKKLPRRHVDTELFESLGKHVDWLSLMEWQ